MKEGKIMASYLTRDQKCRNIALQHNLTVESAQKRQHNFIIATVVLFVLGTLTASLGVGGFLLIGGCFTWYYAVQYGRTKKFIEKNPDYKSQPLENVEKIQNVHLDYPVADFQWDFVKAEIAKLNKLLKTLDCTRKLHMDSNALTPDSYFRYEPFTPKTGKISKYPCILHACSTVYMGYSVSISYDVKDIIGKGQMHISTMSLSYTIDFKNINGDLTITKVITTDDNFNNRKLYHIQKDGTIYTSS